MAALARGSALRLFAPSPSGSRVSQLVPPACCCASLRRPPPQRLQRRPSRSQPRAAPLIAVTAAVAGQESFAGQETEKFLRELPELLEREAPGRGDAVRAARVCAQALGRFFGEYNGKIDPEPFADMKAALSSEEFSATYVDKVLLCAVGWVRTNLSNDFRKWSGSK